MRIGHFVNLRQTTDWFTESCLNKLWEHQPDARVARRTSRIHQKRRGDGGHDPIAGHFPHIARCAGFIVARPAASNGIALTLTGQNLI